VFFLSLCRCVCALCLYVLCMSVSDLCERNPVSCFSAHSHTHTHTHTHTHRYTLCCQWLDRLPQRLHHAAEQLPLLHRCVPSCGLRRVVAYGRVQHGSAFPLSGVQGAPRDVHVRERTQVLGERSLDAAQPTHSHTGATAARSPHPQCHPAVHDRQSPQRANSHRCSGGVYPPQECAYRRVPRQDDTAAEFGSFECASGTPGAAVQRRGEFVAGAEARPAGSSLSADERTRDCDPQGNRHARRADDSVCTGERSCVRSWAGRDQLCAVRW
jgi:hypothetical protein